MKLATKMSAIAVAAFATSAASADPTVFDVLITTNNSGGFTEFQDFVGHQFGTTQSTADPFFITITSQPSQRIGFDYELVIDYSNYDVGFFGAGGNSMVELLGIKGPGDPNQINNAFAKDAFGNSIGSLSFTGGSITWNGNPSAIVAGGEIVTIQWSQVPTPGALALFGVAGVATTRRRR